jgi:F-type H+-transporting ATPase subunit b
MIQIKNLTLPAALLAAVVLAPATVLAAGGGEGGHHSLFTVSFLYSVINFVILVGFLIYVLRKPLRSFLSERREGVRRAIDEAKDAKLKAEQTLAEYRNRMVNLEGELNTLRAEIISTGERERDQLLAAAKTQAEKIIADAKLIGDQEVRRAKIELREEMVRLATQLAEKSLLSSVSAQDQQKQLNDFVSKLEAL